MKVIENVVAQKGKAILRWLKIGSEITYEMNSPDEERDARTEGKLWSVVKAIIDCNGACPDEANCMRKKVNVEVAGQGFTSTWCIDTPRYHVVPKQTWRGKWRI